MKVLVYYECIGGHEHILALIDKIMLIEIIHCIDHRDELGYVRPGFTRQIVVDFPEGFFVSGTANGFSDVSRSGIVGGKGEFPIVEHPVQVAEIAAGGYCCLFGIHALIYVPVLMKSVESAGSRHELPKPYGRYSRHRTWVQG